jgi:hypothetical protein
MVGKRRGGMKADQRHYPVGEYFVDVLDIMRKSAISRPWRGRLE